MSDTFSEEMERKVEALKKSYSLYLERKKETPMSNPKLTEEDLSFLHEYAKCNMRSSDAARRIFVHRNTMEYHLDKVKEKTGLDPRKFHQLVRLLYGAYVCPNCGAMGCAAPQYKFCPNCGEKIVG